MVLVVTTIARVMAVTRMAVARMAVARVAVAGVVAVAGSPSLARRCQVGQFGQRVIAGLLLAVPPTPRVFLSVF